MVDLYIVLDNTSLIERKRWFKLKFDWLLDVELNNNFWCIKWSIDEILVQV